MNKLTVCLLLVVCVVACSRDPYAKYLGLWERVGDRDGWHEVIEIKHDGEAIVFNDNVLAETDMLGRPKQPAVMTQRDGRLSFSNGFASMPLALSDDKQLLFADRRFQHITADRVQEIRSQIVEANRVDEENKVHCKELQAQWSKERNAVYQSKGDWAGAMARQEEVDKRYQAQAKALPRCGFLW